MLAVRDEALAVRDARIDELLVRVAELTAQVQELVMRLGKDSSNSSKPPSQDGPSRRPRGGSSRGSSWRRPGGQPGAPGATLSMAEVPDEVVVIGAPIACGCGLDLAAVPVARVRRRQVVDLPQIPAPVVTEYRAQVKACPGCGAEAQAAFPAGVGAPVQYGPGVCSAVADAVLGHHVPVHRATVLIAELLGVQVSTGFAASLRSRAAAAIEAGGFMDAVRDLLATAPVVHADETFARADKSTSFVHAACTEHLTCLHVGGRSAKDIDAGLVLPRLGPGQALVRDGYAGYAHLTGVEHAWCAAHLLRDLRGIHEADPQRQLWADAMANALLEANRLATAARAQGRDRLDAGELDAIASLYAGALARARQDNPATDTGPLARHARTLAKRFHERRDQILHFTANLAVPFTNNTAERAVRVVKVQQRASGGTWRTITGLAEFAVVHSYLATARAFGHTRIHALTRLFNGTGPWIPHALAPDPA